MSEQILQFKRSVTEAFRELLESKHLFQSIHVGVDSVLEKEPELQTPPVRNKDDKLNVEYLLESLNHSMDRSAKVSVSIRNAFFSKNFKLLWKFGNETESSQSLLVINLPKIRTPCSQCDGVKPPHTPQKSMVIFETSNDEKGPTQIFSIGYECQNCNEEPIFFIIRRDGLKISLVGRSQFKPISAPKCFPKSSQEFYRQAMIAFNTGHCLSGLFYLRTLIEQHMRKIVKPTTRVSGEELADEYQRLLSSDFPKRFLSLKKIYQDLSAAMHSATADRVFFETSLANIEKHFEAWQLLN